MINDYARLWKFLDALRVTSVIKQTLLQQTLDRTYNIAN